MVGGNALLLDGADAEQTVRNIEAGLDDLLQLQIGLELGLREIELLRSDLLGIEAPVPGHHLMVLAIFGNQLGDIGLFLAGTPHSLRPDGAQQLIDGFGLLRHRVVELQFGEIAVAEKRGHFLAKRQRFLDDAAIIGGAGILATGNPGLEGLLAQIALLREGQERFDDRARQRDGKLALFAALARCSRHRILEEFGQALELRAIGEKERPALLVGEHVLTEIGAEAGQLLVDAGELLLLRLRQLGAGLDEALPMPLQHPRLFQRQAELFALFPECIDAGEKRGIHADLRIVPRHLRRDLPLQRLDDLVGMRTGPVPEQCRDPRKLIAGNFQRHDGVLESRRIRIPGDRIDLLLMRRERRIEGGGEIAVIERIEARQAVMPVPVDERRIEFWCGRHAEILLRKAGERQYR